MATGDIFALILGGGAVAAIISGVVQIVLWKLNRKALKADKADGALTHLERAIRTLLHDRIKWLGKAYIRAGEVTTEDLRDLIDMHDCYRGLNGNGLLDNIMKQVKALKIKK